MNILLTGGSGYIGSHCLFSLLDNNYKAVIIDNFSNSSKLSIKAVENICNRKVNFHEVDIKDKSQIVEVFKQYKFDAVIHLAGKKSVAESVKDPLSYYMNNVYGTINLLEVMEEFDVKNLIFSSSATIYGDPKKLPIDESSGHGIPSNPYGQSKIMIENILKDLYNSNNSWSITSLRYFNPVGAHESGEIGENPIGRPNNLMPIICNAAHNPTDIIKIYGTDWGTPDGTGVRDYIHVMDLADGHRSALEYTINNNKIDFINLGNGKGYSVMEIINTFQNTNGLNLNYENHPRRPGDIAECYANANYARDVLNWKPKKNLEDMCKDSWRWKLKHPNGY